MNYFWLNEIEYSYNTYFPEIQNLPINENVQTIENWLRIMAVVA